MIYLYHIPHPEHTSDLLLGYIGVSKNPRKRFRDHLNPKAKTIVHKAIKSYGITEDQLKILFEFEEDKEAFEKEAELRPEAFMGWNQAPGGQGGNLGPCSEETRQKRRSHTGEKNGFFGKKHSEKTRDHISKVLMSKDAEWRRDVASKAGKGNVGKKRTSESIENYKNVANNRPRYTCEHCSKTGQYNAMIAHHGDNCHKKS